MTILAIHSDKAPAPNGHYRQAVVHAGVAYLSMQLPWDPEHQVIADGVDAQADQLIRNCRAVLAAAGSGLDLVLSATVYLSDIADWPRVDRAFSNHFGEHRPARAVVAVHALHLGAQIGMQMIAAVAR